MNTLGDRLRIARERKGFTQVQVKERTNINNKTLSGYEKGVSEPDTKTIVTLAELYEVSYRWLISGQGQIKEHSDSATNNSDDAEDEEFEDFIKDLRRWHKEGPKDKDEDLARLRRIFDAYRNE